MIPSSHIYEANITMGFPCTMILSTILTSPTARVYNLRILLLANIPLMVLFGGTLIDASVILGFSFSIVIWVHHILAIFKWPMRGLALIDLGTIVIEIGVLVSLLAVAGVEYELREWITLPLFLPLGPLLMSLLFRITTVHKTKGRLLTQRLRFLGCCAPSHPPYSPLAIILNRSLARPLVRGESRYIIVSRALVLSCVALGVPAFGIYATVIMPLASVVSTRTIRNPPWTSIILRDPNNATILIRPEVGGQPAGSFEAQVNVTLQGLAKIGCHASTDYAFVQGAEFGNLFICPYGWFDIKKISISVVVPLELDEAYVQLGCGLEQCDDLFYLSTAAIPLLPRSHLFGLLMWSQRKQVGHTRPAFVYAPEIYALQPDPSSEPLGPRSAFLTLHSPYGGPIKFLQDTADASPLSGIATFGGFWTFVNGTFALFFGANVVYFMFGRRPLSALGVVHLFQRRALVRQWYEDFPAIHTEGGLPGSENAGIVAFIRERLVDMGEDPRGLAEGSKDAEEQVPEDSSVSSKMVPSEESADEGVQEDDHRQSPDDSPTMSVKLYPQRPGYILDEIPLLELDLGMDAVTT